MLSDYSVNMLLAMMAIAAAASFFVGNAVNSVLGAAGFGVLGNMTVLFFGFLLGLNVVRHLPYRTLPHELLVPGAIGFAFVCLFGLAVLKRLTEKA